MDIIYWSLIITTILLLFFIGCCIMLIADNKNQKQQIIALKSQIKFLKEDNDILLNGLSDIKKTLSGLKTIKFVF